MISTTIGGIGLFLLGMVLLTDGLKTAAGSALRAVLGRFTGGTLRAILSGAALTALVQSSSATVLTTIGFVSAGLLTLRQAVGVIFGANVGTTSTGWIVSYFGLKLSIGALALPVITVGALMRLLARGRTAAAGLALAGFGVIFLGIDVLQEGMAAVSEHIDPASLPTSGLMGRLLLVGVGAVMTVVMQSSSAAVATTLAALHGGAVSLEQAAALVVGQNIGTALTTALAAIGASVPARRTAVAHIMFNVLTGTVAFFLVPAALFVERTAAAAVGGVEPTLLIAAFHTTFNVVGVVLLLPFIGRFTRLVTRLVPERSLALTRHLDPSVAEVPQVAVEAARRTVMDTTALVMTVFEHALRQPRRDLLRVRDLDTAAAALGDTAHFLGGVRTSENVAEHERHLSVHHAIDHLGRLIDRLVNHAPGGSTDDPAFDTLRLEAAELIAPAQQWLGSAGSVPAPDWPGGAGAAPPATVWEQLSHRIAEQRRTDRAATLQRTARGDIDPTTANANLEAMRWLDSSTYHVWRALHHLTAPDPVAAA